MAARIAGLLDTVRRVGGRGLPSNIFESRPCDINQGLAEMTDLFISRMEAKGIHLKIQKMDKVIAMGNLRLLVDSVLGNLMSNAVKFTPRGGNIHLNIQVEGDKVFIELENEGEGFPQKTLLALEKGEKTGSAPGTEGEKGTGLGLQIARHFLRRMGGDCSFQNTARGARARLWLRRR